MEKREMEKDPRKKIDELIIQVENGKRPPERVWDEIRRLKDEYIEVLRDVHPDKDLEQSWHGYIGNKFQKVIHSIVKGYLIRLKAQDQSFRNFEVLQESEIRKNEIVFRKLAVKYGEYLLLPDTDMAVVKFADLEPWKSEIVAIISCKTSLRERIAQACYWKLKLLASNVTKNIRVFLATTDNDADFVLDKKRRESSNGRSRNRIIAEYELDGIYILRENFKSEWESEKVKRYEKIFEDLSQIFKKT